MKMPPLMEELQAEHREALAHLDALDQSITAIAPERAPDPPSSTDHRRLISEAVKFLETPMMRHLDAEETALFPLMQRRLGSAGPIQVMESEHRWLREHVAELARLTQWDGDIPQNSHWARLRREADQMIEVLTGHIYKEDNVLFPMAAQLLSPADWEETGRLAAAAGVAGQGGRRA